jgi:putative addiction module component (TIGR02574 family)
MQNMSTNTPDIFAAALTLPDSERADLAYQLLNSLPPPGILSEDDPRFAEELERRMVDFESGTATASDIDDMTNRIRTALLHPEGI